MFGIQITIKSAILVVSLRTIINSRIVHHSFLPVQFSITVTVDVLPVISNQRGIPAVTVTDDATAALNASPFCCGYCDRTNDYK